MRSLWFVSRQAAISMLIIAEGTSGSTTAIPDTD